VTYSHSPNKTECPLIFPSTNIKAFRSNNDSSSVKTLHPVPWFRTTVLWVLSYSVHHTVTKSRTSVFSAVAPSHDSVLCCGSFLIQCPSHFNEKSGISFLCHCWERDLCFGRQSLVSPALAPSLCDLTHFQVDRSQNTTIDSGSALTLPFNGFQ
jgi:hypothetical protein